MKIMGLDKNLWELQYKIGVEPRFGYCKFSTREIIIDRTLPFDVQESVLYHELFHTRDKIDDSWLKRESRANWYAFRKAPLKWFYCAVLSIVLPYRIKLYWNKITGK